MVLSKKYTRVTRSASALKAKKKESQRVLKNSRTNTQKKVDKKLLEAIIITVLAKEKEIKNDNKIRLPRSYLKNLVETYTTVIPTLTLKSLENALSYQRNKQKREKEITKQEQPLTIESAETKTSDKGRPKGTTEEAKRIIDVAYAQEMDIKMKTVKQ